MLLKHFLELLESIVVRITNQRFRRFVVRICILQCNVFVQHVDAFENSLCQIYCSYSSMLHNVVTNPSGIRTCLVPLLEKSKSKTMGRK